MARTLVAALAVSLSTLISAGPAHATSASDFIEITDLNGNVLDDAHGQSMVGLLAELPGSEGTANAIVFDLPDNLLPTIPGALPQVFLTEGPPLPFPVLTPVSDIVGISIVNGTSTLTFESDSEAPLGYAPCDTLICIQETGDPQDVTSGFFGTTPVSFRVLVRSDVSDVPEPGTLLLFGGGLVVFGRTRRT